MEIKNLLYYDLPRYIKNQIIIDKGFVPSYLKNSYKGFIDRNGEELIELEYGWTPDYFVEGIGIIKKYTLSGHQFNIIDSSGNKLLPKEFEYITYCQNGYLLCYNDYSDEITLYEKETKEIFLIEGKYFLDFCSKYFILYKDDRCCCIYSIENKSASSEYYSQIIRISEFRFLAQKNEKWFLINEFGEKVGTSTYQFENKWLDPKSFNLIEGKLFKLNHNGKFGAIDFQGKEIIPFIFDSLEQKEGNYIIGEVNKKQAILKTDGNFLTNFIFNKILDISDCFVLDSNEYGLNIYKLKTQSFNPFEKKYYPSSFLAKNFLFAYDGSNTTIIDLENGSIISKINGFPSTSKQQEIIYVFSRSGSLILHANNRSFELHDNEFVNVVTDQIYHKRIKNEKHKFYIDQLIDLSTGKTLDFGKYPFWINLMPIEFFNLNFKYSKELDLIQCFYRDQTIGYITKNLEKLFEGFPPYLYEIADSIERGRHETFFDN